MTEWITGLTNNNSSNSQNTQDGFSIAPGFDSNQSQYAQQPPIKTQTQDQQPVDTLTQLGDTKPSYEIKNVTSQISAKEKSKGLPSWAIPLAVVIPLVVLLTIGLIASKPQSDKKPEASFIFNTLESKYFTLNYSPDYEVQSTVDKTVPFLEKHTLTNNISGNKTLSIVIKNISFNYDIEKNSAVIARRQNSDMYKELPYNINLKEGMYFKKTTENFEHLIVVVDRNQSVLYEIMFYSTSNLSGDVGLEQEFKELLNSMTFL